MTEQMIPALPTLAGMTREERRACQWMQADIESDGRAVILLPNASAGLAILLDQCGESIYVDRDRITPRPDLPRLEWPSGKKPEDVPALPGGWRVADHQKYGRVIVTTPTPNRDGNVHFVLPAEGALGHDWFFCTPAELTYLDQGADQ